MRLALPLVAIVILFAVGVAESTESARQLDELPGRGRPPLTLRGGALTLAGLVVSVATYFALGWLLTRNGEAQRSTLLTGIAVGMTAGFIGGTARALAIRDYLNDTVARFGLPVDVASLVLVIFVVLAALVSAAGGGAVTWLGARLASGRQRPPT